MSNKETTDYKTIRKRSSTARFEGIAKNAVENKLVNKLMQQYYSYLHKILVKCDDDEDIFNITYLFLTRSYKPTYTFEQQFVQTFKNIKRYAKCDDNWKQHAFVDEDDKDKLFKDEAEETDVGSCYLKPNERLLGEIRYYINSLEMIEEFIQRDK